MNDEFGVGSEFINYVSEILNSGIYMGLDYVIYY